MRVCLLALAFTIGCGGPTIQAAPVARNPTTTASKSVPSQPTDLSPAQLVASALPHVLSVKTADGVGSGFFVAEDLVVSCFHVVRGSSDIALKGRNWSGKATAVAISDEADDLAVLRVSPARSVHGLRLSRRPVDVGIRVVVISSPLGLDYSASDGLVSAIREDPSPRIQFSAPISPGSSGGAVIDTQSAVIAVVSSTLTALEAGRTYGQNLNFAVPSAKIFDLLKSAHDEPVDAFAERTIPATERRWKEIEANLPDIERALPQELGLRLAPVYAAAFRQSIMNRDTSALQSLLEKRKELREGRKKLLDVADILSGAGAQGGMVAQALITAWEISIIDPSDENRTVLATRMTQARRYLEALQKESNRPSFPSTFAGFSFMSSATQVYENCFPGYTVAPLSGLASFDCPRMPVPPPFAKGPLNMTFLNGRLVAVEVNVASYRDTVQMISAKYGNPSYSRFEKNQWYGSDTPSLAPNSAFNWQLNGGRIRVGKLTGAPFVTFIRTERDEAINTSF